jgi:hypothetical protein
MWFQISIVCIRMEKLQKNAHLSSILKGPLLGENQVAFAIGLIIIPFLH